MGLNQTCHKPDVTVNFASSEGIFGYRNHSSKTFLKFSDAALHGFETVITKQPMTQCADSLGLTPRDEGNRACTFTLEHPMTLRDVSFVPKTVRACVDNTSVDRCIQCNPSNPDPH